MKLKFVVIWDVTLCTFIRRYSRVQYSTVSTIQYSTVQYSKYSTVQYSKYSTVQYSTVSTVEYSTVQYSKYSTVQYSTDVSRGLLSSSTCNKLVDAFCIGP
jgi:hypothetical protein